MGDRFSFLVALIAVVPLVVSTLLIPSLWRSKPHRKWFYLLLVFYEILWVLVLERLFPLLGMPPAWQDGVEYALFALAVPTLVLLYRRRHDPDPPDPDVP